MMNFRGTPHAPIPKPRNELKNREGAVYNMQDHEIVESKEISGGLLKRLFGPTFFGAVEDRGEIALIRSPAGYNVQTSVGSNEFYSFPNYVNHSRAKVKYDELTK